MKSIHYIFNTKDHFVNMMKNDWTPQDIYTVMSEQLEKIANSIEKERNSLLSLIYEAEKEYNETKLSG